MITNHNTKGPSVQINHVKHGRLIYREYVPYRPGDNDMMRKLIKLSLLLHKEAK